jgi:hypothetical protein
MAYYYVLSATNGVAASSTDAAGVGTAAWNASHGSSPVGWIVRISLPAADPATVDAIKPPWVGQVTASDANDESDIQQSILNGYQVFADLTGTNPVVFVEVWYYHT